MSNAGFHRTWLCPSCHLHSACNHHPQSAVFPVWIRRLTLIRPLFRRRFWLGSTKTMKHASKILKLFPAACWRQMQTSGFWQRPPYSILTRRRNLTILIASSATCHLSGAVSAAPIWHGWRFGSFEVFTFICQKWQSNSPVTRSTASVVSALTALVACGSESVVPYFVTFRYQSSLVRQMRNCYFRNNNRSNGAREVPLCYFYVS